MAIFVKMEQKKNPTKSSYGKWYVRTVPHGTAHTADLARLLSERTTFSAGEVKGMLENLVQEMTHLLQDGQTVVLDGFGRFQLTASSKGVERPEDIDLRHDITKVKCKFLPAGSRDMDNKCIVRDFCKGVRVEWAPK